MRIAVDGLPEVGRSKRTLGVRTGDVANHFDVQAIRHDDRIVPGTGGISVVPNTPLNLPKHLRQVEFGGTGKDPIWAMKEADLLPALAFRQDRATHG